MWQLVHQVHWCIGGASGASGALIGALVVHQVHQVHQLQVHWWCIRCIRCIGAFVVHQVHPVHWCIGGASGASVHHYIMQVRCISASGIVHVHWCIKDTASVDQMHRGELDTLVHGVHQMHWRHRMHHAGVLLAPDVLCIGASGASCVCMRCMRCILCIRCIRHIRVHQVYRALDASWALSASCRCIAASGASYYASVNQVQHRHIR